MGWKSGGAIRKKGIVCKRPGEEGDGGQGVV